MTRLFYFFTISYSYVPSINCIFVPFKENNCYNTLFEET